MERFNFILRVDSQHLFGVCVSASRSALSINSFFHYLYTFV